MLTKNHIDKGGRACIIRSNCCLLWYHKVMLVITPSSHNGWDLSNMHGIIMCPDHSISAQRTYLQIQTPAATPYEFLLQYSLHTCRCHPRFSSFSYLFRTTFIKSIQTIFPWCPLLSGRAQNACLVILSVYSSILTIWFSFMFLNTASQTNMW